MCCVMCQLMIKRIITLKILLQDFELVWRNRAAWGFEDQEGTEASLWQPKDVTKGEHRSARFRAQREYGITVVRLPCLNSISFLAHLSFSNIYAGIRQWVLCSTLATVCRNQACATWFFPMCLTRRTCSTLKITMLVSNKWRETESVFVSLFSIILNLHSRLCMCFKQTAWLLLSATNYEPLSL